MRIGAGNGTDHLHQKNDDEVDQESLFHNIVQFFPVLCLPECGDHCHRKERKLQDPEIIGDVREDPGKIICLTKGMQTCYDMSRNEQYAAQCHGAIDSLMIGDGPGARDHHDQQNKP